FFFSSRRRHTRFSRDWSSDVCSSDLTEGIVLDTAGRYSVSVEDRLEWLTFLDLLKKNRPRAPINGVIIAASIAELSGSKPEFARSEERRVGKERRARRPRCHNKENSR